MFDRAIEIGLKGFALTDHEVLSGHVQMIQTYKKYLEQGKITEDFKIVLGDEIYMIDDIAEHQENYTAATHQYYHFILAAKNAVGYEALKEISSTAWNNSYMQRGMYRTPISKKQIAEIMSRYKGNIIASTACLGGELPRAILKLQKAIKTEDPSEIHNAKIDIDNFLNFCIDTFGIENFFLELQPSTNKDQIEVNTMLLILSTAYGIKAIYSTDSHYESKEKQLIHKSYLNAMDGEREVDDFYSYAYMMGAEEVYSFMEYIPRNVFDQLTQNSIYLMDMCETYDLYKPQFIPTLEVEDYPNIIITEYKGKYVYITKMLSSQDLQNRYWVNECLNALHKKHLVNDIYLQRLDDEAKEIWLISEKLNITMTMYYNTMKKIIELVWNEGDSLVGPARGSATGFLSCYLLGITQMDPIIWNLPYWRHLTSTRPELPDIDFDTQAGRRKRILSAMRDFFNKDIPSIYSRFQNCYNVLNIATFGTEGPKSACITACRGYRSEEFPNGIDSDIAQYLTGMIPSERGFTWSLHDCVYGNEEKDRKIIYPFVREVEKYDDLLNIMLSIEGMVNKRSIHASGMYIYNDGFLKYNAMMKAPSGQEITQFNMNDSDYMGSLKYDFLTIESLDKIRACIDLLSDDGEIEYRNSLKQTYDRYIHPDILDYDNKEIWNLMGNGEVINLFQFDTPVGSQCAKKLKPQSLPDAASANSLMRLMAEQGAEQPMDRYVRMKDNMALWYHEMKQNGLTEQEVKTLEPHYLPVFGTPNTQEDMMEVLMNPNVADFDLIYANKARKIVAKKKMDDVAGFHEEYINKGLAAGSRNQFLDYVWNTSIKPQLGYSFSRNHTTPYTCIALQELNLYYNYPSIYWNTACLTVNSGSMETDEEDAQKSTDYAKMAIAIGDIQNRGVKVSLADINKSVFSFKPDIENDTILFGLKGITNVGDDLVLEIIKNRPYEDMEDFLNKVKINKRAMLNLVKGGAFDKLYKGLPREAILELFIHMISDEKKKLNLQNFNGLIEAGLIPEELSFVVRVYEFNKVLKKYFKDGDDFTLYNEDVLNFYTEHFNTFLLDTRAEGYVISQKVFDKQIYQKQMDVARVWLKKNHDAVLKQYNDILFQAEWDKYCYGNISTWEMEALSFYYHEHELINVDTFKYGISNFENLPESAEVDYFFEKSGKQIPIYKLTRIIGTVIGKNKTNGSISLLTTNGVVTVRFRKEMFALYDKQLSEAQDDGTKKIMERSWFNKGNKLMITGYRRDDQFVPKKYARTPGHTIYRIEEVKDNGEIDVRSER